MHTRREDASVEAGERIDQEQIKSLHPPMDPNTRHQQVSENPGLRFAVPCMIIILAELALKPMAVCQERHNPSVHPSSKLDS